MPPAASFTKFCRLFISWRHASLKGPVLSPWVEFLNILSLTSPKKWTVFNIIITEITGLIYKRAHGNIIHLAISNGSKESFLLFKSNYVDVPTRHLARYHPSFVLHHETSAFALPSFPWTNLLEKNYVYQAPWWRRWWCWPLLFCFHCPES